MTGYWYLATPYSKYRTGIEAAFEMASREAARLLKSGIVVFCPIAHTHPIALHGQIDPKAHDLWMAADRPLMEAAVGLIAVRADGWEESIGMAEEIRTFKAAGKPILFMDPETK